MKNICQAIDVGGDLAARQKLIEQFDSQAVMATPKNSAYNELVMEAGRLSILNDGREVEIKYGKDASVRLKEF